MRKIILLIFLVLRPGHVLAQEPTSGTLAIVVLEQTNSLPEAFVDLLTVELSKAPEISLLEREEVKMILKEQALNLSMAEVSSATIVQAGKILSAQTILLLQREGDEKEVALRARLLHTVLGMRLLDTSLVVGTTVEGLKGSAAQLARSVSQNVARMQIDLEQIQMVGLAPFVSEELAQRWDYISELLPRAIERNLTLYPGVVLMERSSAGTLMEERDLAQGLPQSVSASQILVDGGYRIDPKQQTIFVALRARREGREILAISLQGNLSDIESLGREAADQLHGVLNADIGAAMDRSVEAALLAAEAERYIKREDRRRALPPAEAACALSPENLEYQELLFRSLRGMLDFEVTDSLTPDEAQLLAAYARRSAQLSERIMSLSAGRDYALSGASLGSIREVLEKTQHQDRFQSIHSEFWALHWDHLERIIAQIPPHENFSHLVAEHELLNESCQAIALTRNLDEAIEWAKEIALRQAEVLTELVTSSAPKPPMWGNQPFARKCALKQLPVLLKKNFALPPQSEDELRQRQLIETFVPVDEAAWAKVERGLNEVLELSNPYLRAGALDASFTLHKLKKEKDWPRIQQLVDLYIQQIGAADQPDPWLFTKMQFAADPAASEIIERQILEKIFEWEARQPQYIPVQTGRPVIIGSPEWVWAGLRLSELMARQSDLEKAQSLIDRLVPMMSKYNSSASKSLAAQKARLQQKYGTPGQPATQPPTQRLTRAKDAETSHGLKVNRVLSILDPIFKRPDFERIEFRRLLFSETEAIVVICVDRYDRYGIVRLTRDTFQYKSHQISDEALPLDTLLGWYREENEMGPSVALHGDDVYLGFVHAGIMKFAADGTISRMTEENGALPSDNIRDLQRIGDKLYAFAQSIEQKERGSAVIEVDLLTSQSQIILSSISEKTDIRKLDAPLQSIVADAENNRLWILTGGDSRSPNYLQWYDTQSGTLHNETDEMLNKFLGQTSAFSSQPRRLTLWNHSLMIYNGRGLFLWDTENRKGEKLAYEYYDGTFPSKWQVPSKHGLSDAQHVYRPDRLLCYCDKRLLFFTENKREGVFISSDLFPRVPGPREWYYKHGTVEIHDLVPYGSTIYILTPGVIYSVGGIDAL